MEASKLARESRAALRVLVEHRVVCCGALQNLALQRSTDLRTVKPPRATAAGGSTVLLQRRHRRAAARRTSAWASAQSLFSLPPAPLEICSGYSEAETLMMLYVARVCV